MTIRLDMMCRAKQAKISLGDSAQQVAEFIGGQLNPDGGFKDRSGKSDLYYTVFGIESLLALEADLPHDIISDYLHSFDLNRLNDIVHLSCGDPS